MCAKPLIDFKSRDARITEIVEVGIQTRVIAILRKCPNSALTKVATALEQSGIRLVEVTLDSVDPLIQIEEIISLYPGLIVGAGTVHSANDVKRVAEIGGKFIVAPVISEDVISESLKRGLAVFPGAATPSEIIRAFLLGATAVKVFPAEQLGGPSFLNAIMPPLKNPKLIPTGGVDIRNASRYIEAGAFAVGVGSSVIQAELIKSADFSKLEKNLKEFMKSIL